MGVRIRLVRNASAAGLVELCLVAAVVTVLTVRLLLELSGYPQVGGGGLHIAHVLWGGLLMLLALILMFSVLNARVPWVAALAGGIGFGLFIDEVGKFISEDTNYFFQPAVAVMYVVFVLLFLLLSGIRRWTTSLTPAGALANALDLMRTEAIGSVDPAMRDRIGELLDRADPSHALVGMLRAHLDALPDAPPGRPSVFAVVTAWQRSLAERYQRLCLTRGFGRTLVVAAIGYAVARMATAVATVTDSTALTRDADAATTAHAIQGIAAALSAAFVIVGLLLLRQSRLRAYRWMLRGVLVGILVCDVFNFYHEQFLALAGLLVGLVLYSSLRYMIAREAETQMLDWSGGAADGGGASSSMSAASAADGQSVPTR